MTENNNNNDIEVNTIETEVIKTRLKISELEQKLKAINDELDTYYFPGEDVYHRSDLTTLVCPKKIVNSLVGDRRDELLYPFLKKK